MNRGGRGRNSRAEQGGSEFHELVEAGQGSRTNLIAATLVYLIAATGLFVYARRVLIEAPAFPPPEERLPLVLLGILPASLLAFFAVKLRALVADARRRRYGARLRLKLAALFAAAILAASLPQAGILLSLARAAQASAASDEVRRGLARGLTLLLSYYDEDLARLENIAKHELPALARGRLPAQADRVLESLRAREPRIDALELFSNGESAAFAGAPAARLLRAPAAAAPGALPASAGGGTTRFRYLVPWGTGGDALVLSLRLPDGFDETAEALTQGKRQTELLAAFSPRWAKLLFLVYLLLVAPLLLLALLFGLAASELIAAPLSSLEAATRRIAAGDLSLRLLAKPGDEIGRLIASFNAMLGEIERYRTNELRREKIDAWKDIAQRLAHELKNPLTPIRLAAERLLRLAQSDPERALEVLAPSALAIIAEVEGMDALLSDFRSFAALPEPAYDWTELRPLVEEAVALYEASYPDVSFIRSGVPQGIVLRVDRAQIKRVLTNLFSNALDAMNGKGSLEIRAELVTTAESRYCRLLIRDDGCGVPAGLRERVFTPYFTTKASGTGLGLSIVERIVTDHGGFVRMESEEGVGTSLYIDLPVAGV